jgi:hypothetical protein
MWEIYSTFYMNEKKVDLLKSCGCHHCTKTIMAMKWERLRLLQGKVPVFGVDWSNQARL